MKATLPGGIVIEGTKEEIIDVVKEFSKVKEIQYVPIYPSYPWETQPKTWWITKTTSTGTGVSTASGTSVFWNNSNDDLEKLEAN